MFTVTSTIRNEGAEDSDRFVRTYQLDDHPMKVILFIDQQIDDIANFCCNNDPKNKSLFYADVTFELGDFFLLVTSYKNTRMFHH